MGCRGFCRVFTRLGLIGDAKRKAIRAETEAAEKGTDGCGLSIMGSSVGRLQFMILDAVLMTLSSLVCVLVYYHTVMNKNRTFCIMTV